jgi:cytochrome P450
MGYELPPGTIVGTQAWSMHRSASIFPSPDTFLPDRWLEADDGALALMTRNMMPFGTGSRVCGGQNLAHIMFKIIVAVVSRNFDVFAPKDTSETTMEIKDSFVSDGTGLG